MSEHEHDHDHDHHDHAHHGHGHDHEHGAHAPPAPDDPSPPVESLLLEAALRELLIEKGVITAEELRIAMEAMDARGEELGAKIIARAWSNPDYKQLLLKSPVEAIAKFGLGMGVNELCVVENTERLHNVIVCTLCSCYPRLILGVPPAWYKSKEYRSRVVNEPRAVLAEFGTEFPDDVEVRVHDSTADLRYLVLPMRPQNTEGWSEEALAALVSRDSMIGTAPARTSAQPAR
jgi:nitrile hydratase subunit alpha